jgi:hypothetical protein
MKDGVLGYGYSIAPRADEESGANHQAAPRRHPAMVRFQNRQRPHREINSLVQAAKAKARGYRSLRNLMFT